jgi:hypothetical protein
VGHVTAIAFADRALKLAGALVCVAVLGGCGGVEFQGKIFDYMGVSGDRQQGDVQMAERPPLLVPPNVHKLPQPSQGAAVATARQDWPDDPERVRKRIVEAKEAKQNEVEAEKEPLNPYAGKPTLLDKLFGRKKTEEEPVADVPTPDPSDRVVDNSDTPSQPKGLQPHVPEAPLPDQNDEDFHPSAPDSYNKASGGQAPLGF